MTRADRRRIRFRPLATASATLAAVLCLAACSDDDGPTGPATGTAPDVPPSAQVIAFDVVQEATTPVSGIRDARRLVIADAAGWESLWAEFQALVEPKPAVPAIDFASRMVVAATLGERSSGGYGIGVPEVARDGEVLYVVVEESIPGIECATTDVVTTPAVAVSVPRSAARVLFVERAIAFPCAPGS